MLCSACGQTVPDRAKFCHLCGARIETSESTLPTTSYRLPSPNPNSKRGAWLTLLAIAVIVVVIASVSTNNTPQKKHERAEQSAATGPIAEKPEETVPVPRGNRWQVQEGQNRMDASREVYVGLDADDSVQAFLGPVRPELVVACRKGRTEVYVNVRTVVTGEMMDDGRWLSFVRVRVDDGKPTSQYWQESSDHEALFAPNSIQFARTLARSRKLLFEFRPFQKSAETIEFSLDGLSEVLPKVSEACGWNVDHGSAN